MTGWTTHGRYGFCAHSGGCLSKFWGGVMSWRAKKYRGYAIECVRLANHADTIEKRNKLLELARVWMDAALVEEQFATDARPLSPRVA
jgi:hypothetical protein